jgi:spermidine synthase
VLKHDIVERVLVVEIDEQVIEVSRRFFPNLSMGFNDPRTHIVAMNGVDFIAEAKQKFNIIIVDSTDPVGTAEPLFTSHFFASAFSALKADGIFAAQTESLHFHQGFVCDVQHRLAQIFKFVDLYTVPLATYAGNWWTFSIASKKYNPRKIARECEVKTKYYAADIHQHEACIKS